MDLAVSKRLQKLETDLQLISTIRDILMAESEHGFVDLCPLNNQCSQQPSVEVTSDSHEIPERDTGNKCSKINVNRIAKANVKNPTRHKLVPESCKNINSDANNEQKAESSSVQLPILTQDEVDAEYDFMQRFEYERRRRMDVEESAQIIAVKLQKTEDELEREKETKKNLLLGTLQLKNQLQSYENKIYHLETEILQTQNEKERLSFELDRLSHESAEIETNFQSRIELLQKEKSILETERQQYKDELKCMHEKLNSLRQECSRKEQTLNLEEQRLSSQLDQTISKYVQVEKERDQLASQLKSCSLELKKLKSSAESKRSSFHQKEKAILNELLQKDEKIKNLETDWKEIKDNLESKVSAATSLVSRTKDFIISLQHKKQSYQKELHHQQAKSRTLEIEKERFALNEQKCKEEITNLKERLGILLQDNMEKGKKFQDAKIRLESELQKVHSEKEDLLRNKDLVIHRLESEKRKTEDDAASLLAETEAIKQELKRTSENFQILQKISEDQGRTITKQRGELDRSQEVKHNLEVELRESRETEKALSRRLAQEQKSSKELESQVSELEHHLHLVEQDLRIHNCEDIVDSEWKSKFYSIDKTLRTKESTWQRSLRSIEKERDLALAAARKALRHAEEIKESCETRISKIKSSSAQQVSKLEEEKHEICKEKSKKEYFIQMHDILEKKECAKMIHELESELLQMKQSSAQVTRACSAKIQQLQNALNVCIGQGSVPVFSSASHGGFGDSLAGHFL